MNVEMTTLLNNTETSRSLIEQADNAYSEGDLARAAEKAWESARHALGSIAERRGWKFDTPGDMHSAANMLSKETDQRYIYILFVGAFITPYNLEEGWLTDNYIKYDIQDVKELLTILEDID